MHAYKRLQKQDVVLGTDRTAKVSFAETFVELYEEVMAQVKTVFVDGLPLPGMRITSERNYQKKR
jgi:hypothetical protein